MPHSKIKTVLYGLWILLAASWQITTSRADTVVAESGLSIVDTRGDGDVRIMGSVFDGLTQKVVVGATIQIGELTRESGIGGFFWFENAPAGLGRALTISKDGYVPRIVAVSVAPGVSAVDVGDVMLFPETDAPMIESVRLSPDFAFLGGVSPPARLEIDVNWNGHPPGEVRVFADDKLAKILVGDMKTYSTTFQVDEVFAHKSQPGILKVVAKPTDGPESWGITDEVYVFGFPSYLIPLRDLAFVGQDTISIDFDLPVRKHTVTLPIIGKYGFEFALGASFDYSFGDGSWELAFGVSEGGKQGKRGRRPKHAGRTTYPKPKFYVGKKEIGVSVFFVAAGVALPELGFRWEEVRGDVGLNTRLELGKYGLPDLFGPGLSNLASKVGAEAFVKAVTIGVFAKIGLDGSVAFYPSWPVEFKEATVSLKGGLFAAYEPKISEKLNASFYVGGEFIGDFGWPEPIFRNVRYRAYGGFSVNAWFLHNENEWVFIDWPKAERRLALEGIADLGGGYYRLDAAKNATATWKPRERVWRKKGSEEFLLDNADAQPVGSNEAQSRFRELGEMPAPGAAYLPSTLPDRRIVSNTADENEATLPFAANVYPESEPSLAEKDGKMLLLYTRDGGSEAAANFTRIAWSYYDGGNWSSPKDISDVPNGQFSAQVAFDGNGDAIAVWEQVKNETFVGSDLEEFSMEIEIFYSRWDAATKMWSQAAPLTDNQHLDHSPILVGPVEGGDLLLSWQENRGNKLQGEGVSGSITNTRIPMRRWLTGAGTWDEVQVAVDNLTGDESHSFDAAGKRGVYCYTRDIDGDYETVNDSELFLRYYDCNDATWSDMIRVTDDSVPDRGVTVGVGEDGVANILWRHDKELLLSSGAGGDPVPRGTVRKDVDSLGFSDATLATGPGGHLVVIWSEMSETGPDAHYRVFDPSSNTWGEDKLLSSDSDLERSFAAVWDPLGNMVLAYNNVLIEDVEKVVTVVGGQEITISNVPQSGEVSLELVRRALVKDLRLVRVVADGDRYFPGEDIALTATLINDGDVGVENVTVSFFDDNPAVGGLLIEEVTLPGWLRAGETGEAAIRWIIPEPVKTRNVFAVVGSTLPVSESDDENNFSSVTLGTLDLTLRFKSGKVRRDGSVVTVAEVRNTGTETSPACELKLLQLDPVDGDLVTDLPVGSLESGQVLELSLSFPAGTHPHGLHSYQLILDELNLVGDTFIGDNRVTFGLLLWVDDDNDGIPQGWEESNGLSDSDPNDSAQDQDFDGFSNAQEYLGGTNPNDYRSRMAIDDLAVQYLSGVGGHQTTIAWASVEGRSYDLFRSRNLQDWEAIARGVIATPPLNSVVDTQPTQGGAEYYRIQLSGQETNPVEQ